MKNILFHTINTLVVSGSMYLLYRAAKKQVPLSQNGFYLLRMQKAYLFAGLVSFLLGLAGISIPFAANDFSLSAVVTSLGVFVILGGIGFYMIKLYLNHYVQFNHDLMVVQNAWGHSTTVLFQNIKSARYNSLSGTVIISHSSGKDVGIHEHLVGFQQIIRQIKLANAPTMKDIQI
jgi:hypothetical protein